MKWMKRFSAQCNSAKLEYCISHFKSKGIKEEEKEEEDGATHWTRKNKERKRTMSLLIYNV